MSVGELIKKYLKGDTVIWTVYAFLCLISAIEMYSASSSLAYKSASHTIPVLRHVLFLGVGTLIVVALHFLSLKSFRIGGILGLIISFGLLIYTLFFGVSANEAKRWIGVMGFQFQPSEIAKVALIIFIADRLARCQKENLSADQAFKPIIIALAVFCILIFPENFSTAFLIFSVGILMMVIGRVSFKLIGKTLGVLFVFGAILFFIGFKFEKNQLPPILDRLPTQVARITDHFNENDDNKYVITDKNRQVVNAQIAIANGGVFPKPGTSVQRDYLPEAYSDFIYAIIVEELGLIGAVAVIILYLILLFRAGMITYRSEQTFPALLVIGLSLMIVIQAFASMAVAVHLGPVTGQPLPLISRGGTSIIITCSYFGMILSVTRQLKMGSKKDEITNEDTSEFSDETQNT